MQAELPLAFQTRMSGILGQDDARDFFQQLDGDSPVSIQYHPIKGRIDSDLTAVPWYERGVYLPERPSFTHDPLFQAGSYYVQEAGSMFIAWLVSQLKMPERPWRILDLCAAPGGKSCLLASIMPAGSLLVSNEVIKSRAAILRYNMAKWGLPACWVTQLDPEAFQSLAGFFDLVLVDAPCSGEGLFRKDPNARLEWSEENANLCSARQSRILRSAVPLLNQGGHLIYSTCTFNPAENEAQVQYLEELGLTRVGLQPPSSWGIHNQHHTYQLYPHRTAAEGFFAAALTAPVSGFDEREKKTRPKAKPKKHKTRNQDYISEFPHWTKLPRREVELVSPWLERADRFQYFQNKQGRIYALTKELIPAAQELANKLPRIDLGFPLGQLKGKNFVPAPELAFHTALHPKIDRVEVDRETAISLMRKETPQIDKLKHGFQLVSYQGLGLLWLKGIGKRYNNYWPTEWRIRK
ncbi:MAG: RNA methyltransferase [Bacteroidota bacterium]